MSSSIEFTESAANKVYHLLKEEENFDLNLRAYVTGGGCSGFQYGFTFDEVVNEDDRVIAKTVLDDDTGGEGQVQLVIDAMSYQYLQGSVIDYQEDIQGAQFVIRNPNAKSTCGCGSSFSV